MSAIQRSSFTGFPYGLGAPGVDAIAMTNALVLPQAGVKTLFTIAGGPIEVMKIFGVVTAAIGAVANATKLTATPAVPGTGVDLCLTGDINAAAAGTLLLPITSFATALSIIAGGIGPVASATAYTRFIMAPGTIAVNCAGSDGGGGQVQWFMHYKPLSLGVSQAGLVTITSPLS